MIICYLSIVDMRLGDSISVFGILIALSINNWNEKRLEKILEQEYLVNLKGDFEFNKTRLIKDIVYV